MGNHVKYFTEVQVDNIHSFSIIHLADHLDIGRDQLDLLPYLSPLKSLKPSIAAPQLCDLSHHVSVMATMS